MTVVEVVAIALAIGVGIGGGVRWLMRNRTHLSFSAAVLAGMIGSGIGAGAVSVIAGIMRAGEDSGDAEPFYEQDFPPPVVLLTILAAILFTFLVLLIATRISREPDLSAAELVVAGETAEVEFKSSARYNQHTGQRDPKLELVMAKTIAALNDLKKNQPAQQCGRQCSEGATDHREAPARQSVYLLCARHSAITCDRLRSGACIESVSEAI